ncbi:hypothetical protein HZA57_00135 [Candidatus Poribacteria bacterium]|nr:hypothetical protein [Candidatus Poribacteria bacterium]
MVLESFAVTHDPIESLFRALNDAGVRYLVAGGLAVVGHGHARFTADVDVVLNLDETNVKRALDLFAALGYKPRVPVALGDFLDPENRSRWAVEKHMIAFPIAAAGLSLPPVDLFVETPFDFEVESERSDRFPLKGGVEVPIVCLETLIWMKEAAGRDKDREDLRVLRQLLKQRGANHGP